MAPPEPVQRAARWLRRRRKRAILIGLAGVVVVGGPAALGIEAVIRARLDDRVFLTPTRFYARPTVFYRGATLDRDRVEATLRRLGYVRARGGAVDIGEYYLGSRTWIIGRRPFRLADGVEPGGVAVVELDYAGRVEDVYERDGSPLRLLALEPELLRASHGPATIDRVPVRLADVPDQLVDAILAVEDQRFFDHHGIDIRRIAGAMVANVRSRRLTQGASTLTQQLAKNLFLSPRRSPLRKLREMAMALVLERRHTKETILEAYLNQVYLGQDGGYAIHGVARAAQYYFGNDVGRLELPQAALLAGIIRGPNLYAPFRHGESARERRDLVLRLMRERGMIGDEAYERARRAPLGLRAAPPNARIGRYFIDFAAGTVAERHGRALLDSGVTVFTTLDIGLQEAAERAVEEGLGWLAEEYEPARYGLQAALVALDMQTGDVLALVGGRDYGASQFNRAVHARRQPGSAFKPIVALAALADSGFTLASVLDDAPLSVETPAGVWEPANYDGNFRGPITLRQALERSLNVPFARLGLAVGPRRIVRTARSLGIEGRLAAVPSIALGSNEVSPLELTRAYGVIAAGGYRANTRSVLGVMHRDGRVRDRTAGGGERVYTAAQAYLVTSALEGAVERGTGQGLRRFGYWGAVAAKSGTTNDFRDAWFIGYTPTVAVGVWVGFDDGRTIGLPGSRAALPIFARFLTNAFGRYGEGAFVAPSGLEYGEVEGCNGTYEVFLEGTAPDPQCYRYWDGRRSQWRAPRGVRLRLPLAEQLRRLTRRGGH